MTGASDGPPASGVDDELVPGVRRVRPDDHFLVVAETDASPMHVGTLLFLDAPEGARTGLAATMRRHLAERLPATPLLCRLVAAPDGYDADVWADVATCDLAYHVSQVACDGGDAAVIRDFVARASMDRLDLSRPPFRVYVLDGLADGRSAFYLQMHHAVADGIGFQTVLALLSDAQAPVAPRANDAALPDADTWRAMAEARFATQAEAAALRRERRRAAKAGLAALQADGNVRAPTPDFALSAPTTPHRSYATVSLPLDRIKALAKRAEGTVNDLFLALAATALRSHLNATGALPATPLVANSARSYRRAEHGAFGNRIVAIHPHLATHIADPVARLRAIQREMARERERSGFDEAMLDAPEQPYGARDRRARFAERLADGARLIPGNVTLSNVPGPAETLSYAGFPVLANYPVPILGSGRFLNITSRRNADRLDIGIMCDAAKIPDAAAMAEALVDAVDVYDASFA